MDSDRRAVSAEGVDVIATPQWTPLVGRATAQSRPPDQRSRMRPSVRRSTTSERRPTSQGGRPVPGMAHRRSDSLIGYVEIQDCPQWASAPRAVSGQSAADVAGQLVGASSISSSIATRERRRWVRGRAERPRRPPVTSPRPVRPRLRQLGAVCRSRPHTPLGRRVGIACRASRGVQPDVASTATPVCRSVGACGSAGWLRLFPLTPGASHVPAR